MKTESSPTCIMMIAGEASGDHHGAKLVEALRRKNSGLYFCGIGGPAMKKAGVNIIYDAAKLAVVGLIEVFAKVPDILEGMRRCKGLLKSLRPDLLILIDFPEFNFHIAATAKKLGIPVLFYVSPQVWAWRPGRFKKIRQRVDHVAVILPFEKAYYQKHRIPVTFVGHPLLDSKHIQQRTATANRIRPSAPVVGLLPGSRENEVSRLLPEMLGAARILKHAFHDIRFIISIASTIEIDMVQDLVDRYGGSTAFETIPHNVDKVFERCILVVAASGTVTLEAALMGVPLVVVYKMSPLTFQLAKRLIKVKSISLVNLIAGRNIIPELIQEKATSENIAREITQLLHHPQRLKQIENDLSQVRSRLGQPGASVRVADLALKILAMR
jgi:lipid-A-disaccharide synthase